MGNEINYVCKRTNFIATKIWDDMIPARRSDEIAKLGHLHYMDVDVWNKIEVYQHTLKKQTSKNLKMVYFNH